MKVCLVRPNFQNKQSTVYPPFGLVTMAPYFKDKVDICDFQVGNSLQSNYDVIAFTAFTSQLVTINNLINNLKSQGAKSKFVVGGPGVTSNPDYAKLLLTSADLIFAGDGEYFAEHLEKFLADDVKIADYRKQPYNLDSKKIPSWNIIDYSRFKDTTGFGIEISRGCPFNCVMCTAHMTHGKQWRPRKPSDVVDEIKYLKNNYRCNKFYFSDDNSTVDPSRWTKLMQMIADSELNIKLSVPEGIQAHHLDFETLKLMKDAGLTEFFVGAESGCQRTLDEVINKGGLTIERIEQVIRDSVTLGMKPSCFFVIGFPGETLEEAEKTVNFAEKMRHLGAVNCAVRNAIPMPGTRMFEIAKTKNYLTVPPEKLGDFDFTHSGKHFLKTPDWTPEQIEALVDISRIQESYHHLRLNPSSIVKHPRSSLRLIYKHKSNSRNP